jgi:hypothetical protein
MPCKRRMHLVVAGPCKAVHLARNCLENCVSLTCSKGQREGARVNEVWQQKER